MGSLRSQHRCRRFRVPATNPRMRLLDSALFAVALWVTAGCDKAQAAPGSSVPGAGLAKARVRRDSLARLYAVAPRRRYPAFTRVVDMVPTLASILGVTPLERLDGHVLSAAIM